MLPPPSSLQSHLQQSCTTLALCGTITLSNHTTLSFTDHDRDIPPYRAGLCHFTTPIILESGVSRQSMWLKGATPFGSLNEHDLIHGALKQAVIHIYLVNWANPALETLLLRVGIIQTVTVSNHSFEAEIVGMERRLQRTIGELYSPVCRAQLGDARCRVPLNKRRFSTKIISVKENTCFTLSLPSSDITRWQGSLLEMATHPNVTRPITHITPLTAPHAEVTVEAPFPTLPKPNDVCFLWLQCDKSFQTCVHRFNNALCFRGEPHVPSDAYFGYQGGE